MRLVDIEDAWENLREAGVVKDCEAEEDREDCRTALSQVLAMPRTRCHCSVILVRGAEGSLFQPCIHVGPARSSPWPCGVS